MKHIVLRMDPAELKTSYLHRLADGSFEWRSEAHGRHEFDNKQLADLETALHGGVAVPVNLPDHPAKASAPAPVKPAEPPPARDWLTAWQDEHESPP